jgi:hypothetical protein
VDAKILLFIGLGVVLVVYADALIRGGLVVPAVLQTAIGFGTAFFDMLGIGSFATTTAVYKGQAGQAGQVGQVSQVSQVGQVGQVGRAGLEGRREGSVAKVNA